MGSWFMNLSDYMGGRCLWKFNSMGGWAQKSAFFPLQVFFSGKAKSYHRTSSLSRSQLSLNLL